MLKSMTGFGKCTVSLTGKVVILEIKSLNSKQLDLNIKLPSAFREKESDIRSIISRKLERGKVELTGSIDYTDDFPPVINKPMAIGYYNEIKELANSLNAGDIDILSIVMKMPEVFKSSRELLNEQEWVIIRECLEKAVKELDIFRSQEGSLLENDFKTRVQMIESLLQEVIQFEETRNTRFREKLRDSVAEFYANNTLDSNRFEQEIIYYLEKLDITEEKVRLQKHLDYFMDTLKETEANGRKLSFVTQEMGREINTIGSKANDANIQRIVVQMKDELEKIKEQLANIL
ncbi:MAG: YicC/YloC family endoribonuclease [Lentimicrobiaceae bacterium]